jgi:hypothetical protein
LARASPSRSAERGVGDGEGVGVAELEGVGVTEFESVTLNGRSKPV